MPSILVIMQSMMHQGAITDAANAAAKAAEDAANAAAKAAKDAAKSVGKSFKKLFSDTRLKENVKLVNTVDGLSVYTYNYVGDSVEQKGVMAQELLETRYANAVTLHENGFYQVDYSLLPNGTR